MSGAVPGAAEARANRIGNARDAPNRDDVHWLVSEAIGAWHRLAVLEAERDALTGALARAVEPWRVVTPLGAWRCGYCPGVAERPELIDHAPECPVRMLAQARGGRDGGE